MGTFIKHIPCDNCGSSDANALYEDGSTTCFACDAVVQTAADGTKVAVLSKKNPELLEGSIQDIPNRGLKASTCRLFGYMVGEDHGESCHIAPYRNSVGQVVAQKVRKAGKKFKVVGDGKSLPLFGQHLWGSGKSVVITEGEIDAMSVSQAFDNKWPVVSLPNGAQSAVKALQKAYEWLDGFEKIVLCFDQDEPGQAATQEAAQILPAGKVFLMRLPRKDANEVLVHDGAAPIVKAYWNATQWRPDGIVAVSELRDAVLHPAVVESIPYPYLGLNEKLYGLRRGELVTILSGSGLGKSTLARELAYHLLQNGQSLGGMFIEESNVRTMERLMSIHMSRNVVTRRKDIPEQELEKAFDEMSKMPLYLWDHFGSNDVDVVCQKARYMARALGVGWGVLDHLSILISDSEGDERKLIDKTMTKLRTLCSETGIGLICVAHLTRPSGEKGHEDGARVSAKQARGSHAIIQLSDVVIGLQKPEEDPMGDSIEFVVLKDRLDGNRGPAGTASYNRESGRLVDSAF